MTDLKPLLPDYPPTPMPKPGVKFPPAADPAVSSRKYPPVSRTNSTQPTINQRLRTVAADERKFGPVYGTTKVSGKVDIVEVIAGYLYIRALFCIGEISQFTSIQINDASYLTGDPTGDPNYMGNWEDSAVWTGLGGVPYAASAGEIWLYGGTYYELQSDVTITAYTGSNTPAGYWSGYFDVMITNATVNTHVGTTTQTADSILSAAGGALAGYSETLTGTKDGTAYGIAYAVIKLDLTSYTGGFPRVTAVMNGMKVYDPDTATTIFSTNPALHLRDFLVDPIYGLNSSVNSASVITAADYCDTDYSGESLIECNLDLNSDKPVSSTDWVETLRAYAHVWLDYQDGEYVFISDAARSSDGSIVFADADMATPVFRSVPQIQSIPVRERPNDVVVIYTGTGWTSDRVTSQTSGVQAGTESPVTTEISMPGITSSTQAQRYADRRRKAWELEKFQVMFESLDPGLSISPGERHTLTCALAGLSSVDVRVISRSQTGLGDYSFVTQAYASGVY